MEYTGIPFRGFAISDKTLIILLATHPIVSHYITLHIPFYPDFIVCFRFLVGQIPERYPEYRIAGDQPVLALSAF